MLTLKQEKYTSLYGELKIWRDKTHIFSLEGKKGILPFVSGLRFSANVSYITNDLLKGSRLKAAWGHIVSENEEYNIYSRECDIIIYKEAPGWSIRNWNGDKKNKIMDFYFINKSAAIGVISCKSSMVNSVDRLYPKQMNNFTKNVWLFAECCGHDKEETIRKKARQYGYKDFWSLYSWDNKNKKESIPNQKSWKRFEDTMMKLAKRYPI